MHDCSQGMSSSVGSLKGLTRVFRFLCIQSLMSSIIPI